MLRISDKNWQGVKQEYGVLPRFLTYGSREARKRKLVPVSEYPDLLIPEDEWKERIKEAHEKQTLPIYHFEKAKVVAKDQGKLNYCWAFGISSVMEAMRLLEAQTYERLAPTTLGWLVKWKNVGNHLTETIQGAFYKGISSSKFAKDFYNDPRRFKTGWEDDGLNYRPSEWFDTIGIDRRRRTEEEMVRQCVSLLLSPLPLYIAYNWWSHALMMAGLEWDEKEPYNIRWIGWNSHGDGRIELTGHAGVPDEAYGIRSTTIASSV